MEQFLTDAGLSKYVGRSLEEEYDDVSCIKLMEEKDVEEWAAAVGMKPGAQSKVQCLLLLVVVFVVIIAVLVAEWR